MIEENLIEGSASEAYVVTCYESLDAIPTDQLSRIAYPAQENFFLCAEWFRCLVEYGFPTDLKPRIYIVTDAASTPACFMFCSADRRGSTLRSLSNFYTMEFAANFPGDAEPDPCILHHFVQYVVMERPRWRRILLSHLRADRPTTALLGDAFATGGFVINRYFQFQNWYCDTDGTGFDDYYSQRSSRLKNTISRKEKKIRREHDIEVHIHEQVSDQLIADWEVIYANSWKEKEQFSAFMPDFMRTCANLGVLRLGLLYFDGAPAASQIWITSERRTIIYKLAYDERYANWSVGSILTRDMMRYALDKDRVAEVDYGVGSEPYKREWMTGCRNIVSIEGFNTRSLLGLCLALKWRLITMLKSLRMVQGT